MNSHWFASPLREGERIEVRGSIAHASSKVPTLTLPFSLSKGEAEARSPIVPNI